MTTLLGHLDQRAALAAALDSGDLHHAWLLTGSPGIGKATFAAEAAATLVGGGERSADMIARRAHPDVSFLVREVWDKGRPPRVVPLDERGDNDVPARSIRAAQVRILRGQLAVRPTLSPRRVLLVDAADDLEREGANALLKVLEEPPADTIFLLVSHSPGKLLPTVRSRCRVVRFDPLSDDDTAAVLRRQLPDADDVEIDALVRAGEGSPGQALRFAGQGVADLDAALGRIARSGDADNLERAALAQALSPPSARGRYEALLDRAPRLLAAAARRRSGLSLKVALDAQADARDLAALAIGQSLDAEGTVFEMAGIVARLASRA